MIIKSIVRARYKGPRSASSKLRPYLAKGLLRCMTCGEKAWSQHIKGWNYYRESSAFRGIACSSAGRYWPAPAIDDQIEALVRPAELPLPWQQRALELASAENNLLDLKNERLSLEARRRRVVELYKDGVIDRADFDRDIQLIENRLRVTAPAEASVVEPSMADLERFGDNWELATPEEKHQMLRCMFESLYVEFRTGQIVEVVPKPDFRWVLEAVEITKPPGEVPGDPLLVIGDPEGARGRQSLTVPRWGGLLLANVASSLPIVRLRPLRGKKMRVPDSQPPLFDLR